MGESPRLTFTDIDNVTITVEAWHHPMWGYSTLLVQSGETLSGKVDFRFDPRNAIVYCNGKTHYLPKDSDMRRRVHEFCGNLGPNGIPKGELELERPAGWMFSDKAGVISCFEDVHHGFGMLLGQSYCEQWRGDKDVVRAAMTSTYSSHDVYVAGGPFQFASEELKADRDFVLEMVGLNGHCLWLSAPELREDPDIVAAAMKKDLSAFCTNAMRPCDCVDSSSNFEGQVVFAHPLSANASLLNAVDVRGKIAVVSGGASLSEMAQNCRAAGAIAMIVFGDVPALVSLMGSLLPGLPLPTAMVASSFGSRMKCGDTVAIKCPRGRWAAYLGEVSREIASAFFRQQVDSCIEQTPYFDDVAFVLANVVETGRMDALKYTCKISDEVLFAHCPKDQLGYDFYIRRPWLMPPCCGSEKTTWELVDGSGITARNGGGPPLFTYKNRYTKEESLCRPAGAEKAWQAGDFQEPEPYRGFDGRGPLKIRGHQNLWTNEIHFELEGLSKEHKARVGKGEDGKIVIFKPPKDYAGKPTCCANPGFHQTKEVVMRLRMNQGKDKEIGSWESHGFPCSNDVDWKPSAKSEL